MEAPRDRRLRLEYERMKQMAEDNSRISFWAEGSRPIEYRITLNCRGIEAVQNDEIVYRDEHRVLVQLTPEFPLEAPAIFWVTPLYHPNVFPPAVCLGDYWYPGWSLAEMCEALYDMTVFNTFNIYDPLNPEAARWLEERIQKGEVISLDNLRYSDNSDFEINAVIRTD
jgi:ubiquitin-protein ligase